MPMWDKPQFNQFVHFTPAGDAIELMLSFIELLRSSKVVERALLYAVNWLCWTDIGASRSSSSCFSSCLGERSCFIWPQIAPKSSHSQCNRVFIWVLSKPSNRILHTLCFHRHRKGRDSDASRMLGVTSSLKFLLSRAFTELLKQVVQFLFRP